MLGSWQKLWGHCVSVYLNGKALAQVATTCYPGVIVDQNLLTTYVLRKIKCNKYSVWGLYLLPIVSIVSDIYINCRLLWCDVDAHGCNAFEAARGWAHTFKGLLECFSFVNLTSERHNFLFKLLHHNFWEISLFVHLQDK